MTTKSLAYDNAAYLAVFPIDVTGTAGNAITGSATNTSIHSAFTSLLIKSVTTYATVIGTSIDTPLLVFRLMGNGTTAVNTITATYTMTTPLGSAAYFANSVLNTASAVSTSGTTGALAITDGAGHIILNQGDKWYIQKGTDATCTVAYQVEAAIYPLSNVTA